MFKHIVHYFILLHLLGSLCWKITDASSSNETQALIDDDEELTESDVQELKERVRRLIPYMMYYNLNNGVNQEYKEVKSSSEPPVRKPQYYLVHRENPSTKISHKAPNPPRKSPYKFIPSIQYNPKDIGPDSDHFIPIRYGTKLSSSFLPLDYKPYEDRDFPKEHLLNDKYTTPRPRKFYHLLDPEKHRNYLGTKSTFKSISTPIQSEFASFDYADNSRMVDKINKGSLAIDYSPILDTDFESHRYITPDYPRPSKYVSITKPDSETIRFPLNLINTNHILKSLQLTNRLPENLNNDNLDSSIKTLVEILDILNNGQRNEESQPVPLTHFPKHNEFKGHYKKPQVITQMHYEATQKPLKGDLIRYKSQPHLKQHEIKNDSKYITKLEHANEDEKEKKIIQYYVPIVQNVDNDYVGFIDNEKYIPQRPITPSNIKDSDDYSYDINQSNDDTLEDDRFTVVAPISEPPTASREKPKHSDDISAPKQAVVLPPPSFKYGATRGKPHIDYPAYSSIPETSFNCKKQRYKGFFGDPSTGCQVWHYCDLNGGKSSFLCPNGTIFSQIALTCDWWFNVKCEATTQLYVLNERLYKYILPIMPKFPEDFTGPEVDRYLEIKFKEMEAKLREKKLKKQQEEKEKDKLKTKEPPKNKGKR